MSLLFICLTIIIMSYAARFLLLLVFLIAIYLKYASEPFSAIILAIIIVLLSAFGPFFFGSTWLPISDKSLEKMMKIAGIKNTDIIYDLGCGNGKIIKKCGNAKKAIGIELSPLLYIWAKINTLGMKNAEIKYGNFFNFDLKDGNVFFVYMPERTLNIIENKKIFKKGSRIITRKFRFSNIKPVKQIEDVYLYII